MSLLAPPALNLPTAGSTTTASRDDPARIRDAGRQFESLLITQILHSARECGAGWLGAPEDSASDCATDYAEQQFAAVLSQAGGLGIARMIESGLRKAPSPEPPRTSPLSTRPPAPSTERP